MSGKNLVLDIWRQKGVKRGQTGVKMELFDNISKTLHLFFYIFYTLIEVNSVLLLAKTACPANTWFSRYVAKRVKTGLKMAFFDYSSKSHYSFS